MGRTRACHGDKVGSVSSLGDQSSVRHSKRPPLVPVLEDEALVVYFSIANDSSYAVCICRPVCNSHGIIHLWLTHVTGGSGFGDDIVGYHASTVADVEFVWEVVVIGELITAVSKA